MPSNPFACSQQNPWCVHLAWRLLTAPAAVARLLDDASPWRQAPPRQVRVMRWRMDFTRAAWSRPRRGPHDTELPVVSTSSPLWCARGPDLWYGWDLWQARWLASPGRLHHGCSAGIALPCWLHQGFLPCKASSKFGSEKSSRQLAVALVCVHDVYVVHASLAVCPKLSPCYL